MRPRRAISEDVVRCERNEYSIIIIDDHHPLEANERVPRSNDSILSTILCTFPKILFFLDKSDEDTRRQK